MTIRISHIAVLTILLCTFVLPFHALAQNRILNIRHWVAPDHIRVVIDTTEDVSYTVEKKEKMVKILFKEAQYWKGLPHEILLKKSGVDKVRATVLPEGGVLVEVSTADHIDAKVFVLKKVEGKPDRVVIDLALPEIEKKASQEREQIKVSRQNRIIVIDPGHGGEDPGAIGRYGTQEKNIVLQISRKLKNYLNNKEGYRAFLTRDGDYYVAFKKRLKIAREYGADLFISIHADAFKNRRARGSSVYCLSVQGASSEAAKLLARQQNMADIIGGSTNGDDEESDPIILNMFQTNTINASKNFGSNLLRYMNDVGYLKFNSVQEAAFRVLKLPDIPSVLVETAYISNPNEERLLRTDTHQKKIAKAIVSAITEFMPSETVLAMQQENDQEEDEDASSEEPETVVREKKEVVQPAKSFAKKKPAAKVRISLYRIARGDTFAEIAGKHGMTVDALLQLNHMRRSNTLYAGRKLKVVAAEKKRKPLKGKGKQKHQTENDQATLSPEPTVTIYKVKQGDTLDKIAKKFNVKFAVLLKLNRMKASDPLYAGQKLKIVKTTERVVQGKKKPVTVSEHEIYKVKRGDTLGKIAKKYETSIQELRKLNRIKRSEALNAGRKLKVPHKSIEE